MGRALLKMSRDEQDGERAEASAELRSRCHGQGSQWGGTWPLRRVQNERVQKHLKVFKQTQRVMEIMCIDLVAPISFGREGEKNLSQCCVGAWTFLNEGFNGGISHLYKSDWTTCSPSFFFFTLSHPYSIYLLIFRKYLVDTLLPKSLMYSLTSQRIIVI